MAISAAPVRSGADQGEFLRQRFGGRRSSRTGAIVSCPGRTVGGRGQTNIGRVNRRGRRGNSAIGKWIFAQPQSNEWRFLSCQGGAGIQGAESHILYRRMGWWFHRIQGQRDVRRSGHLPPTRRRRIAKGGAMFEPVGCSGPSQAGSALSRTSQSPGYDNIGSLPAR